MGPLATISLGPGHVLCVIMWFITGNSILRAMANNFNGAHHTSCSNQDLRWYLFVSGAWFLLVCWLLPPAVLVQCTFQSLMLLAVPQLLPLLLQMDASKTFVFSLVFSIHFFMVLVGRICTNINTIYVLLSFPLFL